MHVDFYCPLCGKKDSVRKKDGLQGMSCTGCGTLLRLEWSLEILKIEVIPSNREWSVSVHL